MRFCFILLFTYVLFGCSSYKFAKESVFVDDVDEYFNQKHEVNVWMYMNFYPYRGGENGVRLNDFYPQDKEVLKKIGLRNKGARVLFSAVPNIQPNYHLLAILHESNYPKTNDFNKVIIDKKYAYYQKDFVLGRLDIRHVVIPSADNKKMLSMIYYISSEQHLNCPYCKFDYLAKVNTINLQDTFLRYRNNWFIAENISDISKDVKIEVPENIKSTKQKVLLKLFAEYETQTGINYFHILERKNKENELRIKLLPNRYFLEYQDENFKVIRRDTIHVN